MCDVVCVCDVVNPPRVQSREGARRPVLSAPAGSLTLAGAAADRADELAGHIAVIKKFEKTLRYGGTGRRVTQATRQCTSVSPWPCEGTCRA